MQLKLMCYGDAGECTQSPAECKSIMCNRDLMQKVIKSLVRPQLIPVIHRVFEVEELFQLAEIVSLGENQLHHIVRMCEQVGRLKDDCLESLNIEREHLFTAVLFHDAGKGAEIDDSGFKPEADKPVKIPKKIRNYGVPDWVEYHWPIHDHIERSVNIAEAYNLEEEILQAIAMHHHVKILPEVLNQLAAGLFLPNVICEDILRYRPEQYSAKGSILAQMVAALDQLCAIERKFEGKVYLSREPAKLEDELVKDLVIGVTDVLDPRLELLGNSLHGYETVIIFDLRSFGTFVQENSEYRVQAVKREVLNTIRSVIRVQSRSRNKDMVGLIGGDEYAVITKVDEENLVNIMIDRIRSIVKTRTGLSVRYGYGIGKSIEANFHVARKIAEMQK